MKIRCSRLGKRAFLWLLMLLPVRLICAQDPSKAAFGNLTPADFTVPASPVLTGNESAVILSDNGAVRFLGNEYYSFSFEYKRFLRVKIIHVAGTDDLTTLRIILYGKGKLKDKIDDLRVVTYNLENGRIVSTAVKEEDIYQDKITQYITEEKMAAPAVKDGSIIEFSYTLIGNNFSHLPSWSFQFANFPCLHSQFTLTIPDAARYLVRRYGVDSFYRKEAVEIKNNKYILGDLTVLSNDMKYTWVMKNTPALNGDRFVFSRNEFRDRLEFTLAQMYNGQEVVDFSTSWPKVTTELLGDPDFGLPIDSSSLFNLQNTANKLTTGITDPRKTAVALYEYVRDHFTCLGKGLYTTQDLYNVNKNKRGNVADLNLLLIGLLRLKGIRADPVILSTRSFGTNSSQYPLLSKMNYVICMITSFVDTVFLDASDPSLAFGDLPLECYNGHARVISENGTSLYFNTADIREQESVSVFINNEGPGKLGGSFEKIYGPFGKQALREDLKSTPIKDRFDAIQQSMEGEFVIEKPGIDSLDKPGEPAREHFEFTMSVSTDMIVFYPIFGNDYEKNPFAAETRQLPVQLAIPIDEQYTLNMEVPEGYVVDGLPKSVKASFNEDQGSFEYLVIQNGNRIQLRATLKIHAVEFDPEDYPSLRDFFTFIVGKYREPIVFKKK